jgi:hypothetical protein
MDAGSPAAPLPFISGNGPELAFNFSADTTSCAIENTGAIPEVVLDGTDARGGNPVGENTEKSGA